MFLKHQTTVSVARFALLAIIIFTKACIKRQSPTDRFSFRYKINQKAHKYVVMTEGYYTGIIAKMATSKLDINY